MFGVACTFFGYRCFKAVMFFTGFIFASIVVYLICLEEDVLPMWSNALIAVCAGTSCLHHFSCFVAFSMVFFSGKMFTR